MNETKRAIVSEPGGRLLAQRAHNLGQLHVEWGTGNGAHQLAKTSGWPTPTLDFKRAFIAKMLESDENFEVAVGSSGIDVYVPSDFK